MPALCHPEAHDLCGPKDLCNRGAHEAEMLRSFAAEDAAQDDKFRWRFLRRLAGSGKLDSVHACERE